jgi:hypothetical protein
MWPPHVSGREGGKIRTGSVLNDFGPWAASGLGRNGFPAAFSSLLYSFSFFSVFPISFISFAKFIQINSNLFLYSSNIPH